MPIMPPLPVPWVRVFLTEPRSAVVSSLPQYCFDVFRRVGESPSTGPPLVPARRIPDVDGGTDQHLNSVADQYINQLCAEGFDRYSATRALQLTKNDIDVARNILKEFGPR